MAQNTVQTFEPLPKGMAQKIAQAGWPILTGTIDESAGCGVISKTCRCVWTTDGRRVEVSMDYGTFICSQSKDVDPLYAERKAIKAGA